jgi:hypothetical protein
MNVLYWYNDNEVSWYFVFIDSSPSDPGFANATGGPSAIYSDRMINSTYSCQSFPVIGGGNGTVANLTIQKNSNGDTGNVSLPTIAGLETRHISLTQIQAVGMAAALLRLSKQLPLPLGITNATSLLGPLSTPNYQNTTSESNSARWHPPALRFKVMV